MRGDLLRFRRPGVCDLSMLLWMARTSSKTSIGSITLLSSANRLAASKAGQPKVLEALPSRPRADIRRSPENVNAAAAMNNVPHTGLAVTGPSD